MCPIAFPQETLGLPTSRVKYELKISKLLAKIVYELKSNRCFSCHSYIIMYRVELSKKVYTESVTPLTGISFRHKVFMANQTIKAREGGI